MLQAMLGDARFIAVMLILNELIGVRNASTSLNDVIRPLEDTQHRLFLTGSRKRFLD